MILDTNALSAVAEGEPAAVAEFTRAKQVAIPVVVLGEYRFGIAQSRRKGEFERWLDEMIQVVPVLDVTEKKLRGIMPIFVWS